MASQVLPGRYRYGMVASIKTGRATPIEEFPCARKPDFDGYVNGDATSATPMPMSSRSIAKSTRHDSEQSPRPKHGVDHIPQQMLSLVCQVLTIQGEGQMNWMQFDLFVEIA